MTYAVTVSKEQAREIGINLNEPIVIQSHTFDLQANFDKIKSVADRQWAAVREESQERRRKSGDYLHLSPEKWLERYKESKGT